MSQQQRSPAARAREAYELLDSITEEEAGEWATFGENVTEMAETYSEGLKN